jgi:hypothetical protein
MSEKHKFWNIIKEVKKKNCTCLLVKAKNIILMIDSEIISQLEANLKIYDKGILLPQICCMREIMKQNYTCLMLFIQNSNSNSTSNDITVERICC